MDFSLIFKHQDMLLNGALVTLEVTFGALALGLFLGIFAGIGRISRRTVVRMAADAYIQVIRGTPMLLQIFFFYLGFPQLYMLATGQGITPDPLITGIVALGINSGAYNAEIIRAGIQSIDKGQMEAARGTGLSHVQAMFWVILPQALKRMIPPLGNELIVLLKDSSLISTIGVAELMFTAKVLGAKYYTYVPFLVGVACIYLTLTFGFSRLFNALERKLHAGSGARQVKNAVLDLG
ncbi:MAG: amino acid ABC transporter permease [Pseudodesulfovibrio sp.]|jgi:His/Glu/Gln/Arg/opine family amino acid ABC transporter permease subunit|uniref:Putative glutamine transport system permease protein GlnP n=1 Tax=Pseudodesulfovibrio indicus TaxID=1716143 RepID=A0A126QP44_9BACT|nr:amino acid ABC transporter permease [Pseudodesulfovibrio indicus]AMK11684.1 polar amino acid ABC transporter permease [Pseudodesulfovibrio indicus]TDT88212.1 amino acid ABC transporter membrane protein (PAAT family) [Pseudodesulfovibrio indicus]